MNASKPIVGLNRNKGHRPEVLELIEFYHNGELTPEELMSEFEDLHIHGDWNTEKTSYLGFDYDHQVWVEV
jgi:hypothetical protein